MAKRWGPWIQEMLDKMRHDVTEFHGAYLDEIRKQIAAHPERNESIPGWFKGGRVVQTTACNDGVVIVHYPYDTENMTFPDREDTFTFNLVPDTLVKELVEDSYNPPLMGGEKPPRLIPDYSPVEDFGANYWPEPRQQITPLSVGQSLFQQSHWTRLDYASMYRLDAYQDVAWAREQARYILRPYLEGE